VSKGYAEGSAIEERLAALERGDADAGLPEPDRAAVYGATEDDAEKHFLGWADEVDADALFAAGKAWGISIVRRRP
jgi:hypothetical protein